MVKVRQGMLQNAKGTHSMLVTRLLPRGDSTYEGLRQETLDVTYAWERVGPFILCYVLADDDINKVSLEPLEGAAERVSYWHQLQQYGDELGAESNRRQLPRSHPKYPGATLTFNSTTVCTLSTCARLELRLTRIGVQIWLRARLSSRSATPACSRPKTSRRFTST